MDTIKYNIFLRILETGSLAAAAEETGYSPSGMTRMMDSLERKPDSPFSIVPVMVCASPGKERPFFLPSVPW